MRSIATARLDLEPLVVAHADAMFEVLRDPALYRYLDRPPHPDVDHTREVYRRLESRVSPDRRQRWLNWIVVPRGEPPVGFVQATVDGDAAWIAYLIAVGHQGRGYATEAMVAMTGQLSNDLGVHRLLATVEAANAPSIALLRRIGLRPATDAERADRSLTATERLFVR